MRPTPYTLGHPSLSYTFETANGKVKFYCDWYDHSLTQDDQTAGRPYDESEAYPCQGFNSGNVGNQADPDSATRFDIGHYAFEPPGSMVNKEIVPNAVTGKGLWVYEGWGTVVGPVSVTEHLRLVPLNS